uniref:Uncharacterized protein n=1 Tax=Romanomermis culicivorax TaxID=13658 RepID=A0A915JZ31_ROMCU
RNVFDPNAPAFPNANIPFFQPWPYPLPTSAPNLYEPFMPKPPDQYSNPFLKHMDDGYSPNFGFGYSQIQPRLLGGALYL